MTHPASPSPSAPPAVTVTEPDGTEHPVEPGTSVFFGRSPELDIVMPRDDLSLSREAGEIAAEETGARVTNLSDAHSLMVVAGARTNTLPRVSKGAVAASFLVNSGTVLVGSPSMHHRDRPLRVTVDARGRSARRTAPRSATEEPSTRGAWEINTATRYFAVALVLCHDRLADEVHADRLPTVPEITVRVLKMVNDWERVRAIESGDRKVKNDTTAKVREHLKYLKEKLTERRLVPAGTRVTRESLAHYLVSLEILRPEHLKLPDDPDWLTIQEQLWWAGDDGKRDADGG